MGFLYYDFYYLILVVPAMLISLWAQANIKSTYRKQGKILNSRGITGAQAAAAVLRYYGINDVQICQIKGTLTDNYNPSNKVLSLSQGVFNNTSIAAVGIACHEVGHAIQHDCGYMPIRLRTALVPVCNVGSTIGLPLAIIGYFLGMGSLVSVGLILYALVSVFQFVTLPVEFNASRRALIAIEEQGLLTESENKGAKKVLTAAALTYVAALIVSLANLLRFIIRFGNRKN